MDNCRFLHLIGLQRNPAFDPRNHYLREIHKHNQRYAQLKGIVLSYQKYIVLKFISPQFELVTPARTATEALMRTDPRESIQGLVPRMKPFPYRGNIPDEIHES